MTEPTDPYDEPRPPGSAWTRVNIGEAIPGVPTPLSWSVWRPAMEHGFWWAQRQLGVVGRREGTPPVTGIASGHPCVSVDVSLAQVGRLPGYDAGAFAEQYFGLSPDEAPVAASPSLASQARTVLRVGRRAPVSLARLRRWSTQNAADAERWWSTTVHGPAADDPLAVLLEAAGRFRDAMAIHTFEGIACQGAFERANALGPDLVASDGDLAEARLAADLWSVAHGLLDRDAFLVEHGFHGPEEGELAARSWREAPDLLDATLGSWATAPEDRSPRAAAERRAHARASAEAELLAGLPRWRHRPTRTLLGAARWLVTHREVGKAAFLRHLDVARWAARQLGDDAVWCTLDELQRGRPSPGVLDERRRRRGELEALRLPLTWVGDPVPEPVTAPVDGRGGQPGEVHGLGASPGVVVGRARIVVDPGALQEPIGADEVLVARTTDPSWVTLFLTAGGLVIDIGGALSHGAIIARELGVPCVIGTTDGTARIPEGATVTVDGTTGVVLIGP